MNDVLATMVTMTTYGTWLRGDERGRVQDARLWPPNPLLEAEDRRRMKHPEFRFSSEDRHYVGQRIGQALTRRLSQNILALTVRSWHVHFVVGASAHPVDAIVKCANDAVRWGLRPGRPIWTDGYDKRFCYDEVSVLHRIEYVERHNLEDGLPARPWPFIVDAF